MKILLLGGSGTLGTELQKINPDIICPTSRQCNINDSKQLYDYVGFCAPDMIIHAAAMTDNRVVEKAPNSAIQTNIIGTANVAMVANIFNIRLVYISTDYVYHDGSHGNYKETDCCAPFNFYAMTKLGGECSVNGVTNHLIIRTSFGKNEFDYPEAFVDKWTSKDYVDIVAGMILEAALSPLTGILNIGTERKTLYDYATRRNPNVKPVKLADTSFNTPYDTSLNLQRWLDYKGTKSVARPHTVCRACGSKNLKKYLDLGLMPLANNLEYSQKRAKEQERYPLQIMFCEDCSLSQLSVIVDPSKLFSYYTYRSSVNAPYITHCRNMAKDLKSRCSLDESCLHIDIAGNDGTLLKEFKDEIGLRVINVDPAENLTDISNAQGIPAITDFWSEALANEILEKHGKADLITATNVFAHVDDIIGFLKGAHTLIGDSGYLVIECPYIIDFIETMDFPQTYYEHLSYVGITPISKLCAKLGMRIVNVEKQDIHGGTVRMIIVSENSLVTANDSVEQFLTNEALNGFIKFEMYENWMIKVNDVVTQFKDTLLRLKKEGKSIAGFAASAKGNTLLNCAQMNTDVISYIIDQTPEKIGKYSTGTGIPITGLHAIQKQPTDYIVVLSWNFKDAIITKLRQNGYKGKFIIPIPSLQIVE